MAKLIGAVAMVVLGIGCGKKAGPADPNAGADGGVSVSADGVSVSADGGVGEDDDASADAGDDASIRADAGLDAGVGVGAEVSPGAGDRLSAPGSDARRPRVSPDGKQVVFMVGPEGGREIQLVAIGGGAPRVLAAHTADDRDPTWSRDGTRVIFASNRSGKGYDLFVVDAAREGAEAEPLPGADPAVDELEPDVSPLEYTFSAVSPSSCNRDGAMGVPVGRYEKVAFTRVDAAGARQVWFQSLDGAHRGRISPADRACAGPRYSGDGLSLAMSCGGADGALGVAHDTRAVWDQSFSAALKAIGYDALDDLDEEGEPARGSPPRCDDPDDPKSWRADGCLSKLPRRYATHAPAPVPADAGALAAVDYATNQTLLLATGPGGALTRERRDGASWSPLAVEGASAIVALDWAPDGASVVVERRGKDGAHEIARLSTDYPLQDVKDLVDYPELWGEGATERLQRNRFVVRPGTEKELFTAYDKVMYARRAPFVTADAMLQTLRDEVATLLKDAETSAADDLRTLTEALMKSYAARDDEVSRYYATHFAIAWAALAAAEALPEPAERYPGDDEDRPAEKPPIEGMKDELAKVMAAVPEPIRTRVKDALDKALAHEGFIEVTVPGRKDAVPVDFSQMKPRGHYAESPLAGYFIAMKWLSMVPLPLDASAVALVRTMQEQGLIQRWRAIDQMVGAFMGKPIDVTVSHLEALLAKDPAVVEPRFDKNKAHAALSAMLGELGIRGLAQALSDDAGGGAVAREPAFMFFPLRLGLDVPTFTGLTHPKVPQRGLPSSVDVLAALDVPAAARIALTQEKGKSWQDTYQSELAALRAKAPAQDDPLWTTDLYHAWLALLRTMATPMKTPAEARLLFTESPAWEERLVAGALGGYAQLKHDAVLYAFQDFSAQCDSGFSVFTYVEQPVLPKPRGFVEPNPAFFRAAAALAKRAYAVFSPEHEPSVGNLWDDEGNEIAMNARILAERLAAIAQRQLDGRAIDDADIDFLRTIGGTFEAIFLSQQKGDGLTSGAARQERGIALVTDVHTNVTSQVALTIGIGRVDRIYVAVPDAIGARMTEGGVFSFYETTQPISDRLTDAQWHAKILAGELPPRPPWVSSFFEPAPRPGGK